MDQLDVFTVSDNDVAKWDKRCTTLKKEASLQNEESPGAVFGPSSGMSIRYPLQDTLELEILAF